MVHGSQEDELSLPPQRNLTQTVDSNRLQRTLIESINVLDHLGEEPGERVVERDRLAGDVEIGELVGRSSKSDGVEGGFASSAHASEEGGESSSELQRRSALVGLAEGATDLAELNGHVEGDDPEIRLVLDMSVDCSSVGVHRGEEGEEGRKVLHERRGVADEGLDGGGGDEVVEVGEDLEVALLLEGGRFGVDAPDGGIGREDEVLLARGVRGVELLGEEGEEDGDEVGEEVVLRDEVGRDGGDGEDLDAEENDRVLRLAVGEEVGFSDLGVRLGELYACKVEKRFEGKAERSASAFLIGPEREKAATHSAPF